MSLPELEGRTAVVTGASRGLGAGLAEEFASRGLRLGLCSRSAPALAASQQVVCERLDVRDEKAMARFVERVEKQFGEIDLWINNAGVLDPIGPLRDMESTAFLEHIEINLVGVFLGSRAYVRHLRARSRRGVLINVSSGAAWKGYEGWSAYCAAKAAADRLTECIAMEEKEAGLRAFSVAPGVIDTAMQEKIRACSPEQFPEVERFRALVGSGSFNSARFIAEQFLRLAFDPECSQGPVAVRLPDETA